MINDSASSANLFAHSGVAIRIPPVTALPRRVPARFASCARLQANKFALHMTKRHYACAPAPFSVKKTFASFDATINHFGI